MFQFISLTQYQLIEAHGADAEKYAVSVAVTFGYRAKDIRPKSRKPLNEIVHWIE